MQTGENAKADGADTAQKARLEWPSMMTEAERDAVNVARQEKLRALDCLGSA